MTASAPSDDDIRDAFFSLGLQYYISGRYLTFAKQIPVCGNLLHHAVEMFLKGRLARLGLRELKRLGHVLPDVWDAFKNDVGDPALNRFDVVVADLDRFDFIRYPDQMLSEGAQSHIELVHGRAGAAAARLPRSVPYYHFVLSDIDELVKVLFGNAVNPRFYTNSLQPEARAVLDRDPKALI